jgi:hypothetical protein
MFDNLRQLHNALKRAAEDLATARVLIDAALRHLQDRLEEFLSREREVAKVSRGLRP